MANRIAPSKANDKAPREVGQEGLYVTSGVQIHRDRGEEERVKDARLRHQQEDRGGGVRQGRMAVNHRSGGSPSVSHASARRSVQSLAGGPGHRGVHHHISK